MKTNTVTSINLNNFPENNKRVARLQNQSFCGLGTGVIVPIMDGVDRGGIAASFTVQDMFGTNIPRTIKGLYRNKDLTGEYNFQEAKEVALREFITGPSMFIIPMAALALIKKFAGKAFAVPLARTKAFSDILNDNKNLFSAESLSSDTAAFKQKYYTKIFENVLKSSTNNLSEEKISENAVYFAQKVIDIEGSKSKSFLKKLGNIKVPSSKEDKIEELVDRFVSLTKASTGEKTKDLFEASITKNGQNIVSAKITNLLESLVDYTNDVLKTGSKKLTNFDEKSVGDFISSFTKNRVSGRFILNLALCASVIGFCTTIPKIYMQNKKFPGLNGLKTDGNQLQVNQIASAMEMEGVTNENK